MSPCPPDASFGSGGEVRGARIPADEKHLPLARAFIVDNEPRVHEVELSNYSVRSARTVEQLGRILEEPTLDMDAFLIHYRLKLVPAATIVKQIRDNDRRVGIFVYTRQTGKDLDQWHHSGEAQSAIADIRAKVVEAGADLFYPNFGFHNGRDVGKMLELIISKEKALLLLEWQRRWQSLKTEESDWISAIETLMGWHRLDGFARGRFFYQSPGQGSHLCLRSFGHSKAEEEQLRYSVVELAPVLGAMAREDRNVSYWTRGRLEAVYEESRQRIPDRMRRTYFDGEEFPWVYLTLRHGSDILGNISLDRKGCRDPLITATNIESLTMCSRWVSRLFSDLWRREQKAGAGDGQAAASAPPGAIDLDKIVREDPAFDRVLTEATAYAPLANPVLILGETGVGKEIVARYLHSLSRQRDEKFLAVNCAAMVPTLANELFGSVRGAYTGATDRAGYFEAVHGGTLFLDEIGDLDLEIQGRLLRVLETGEIVRVGDSVPRRVHFRLLCATNRDLRTLVRQGAFRQDLYFRIAGYRLEVPPLRQRPRDIDVFISRALAEYGSRHHTAVTISRKARRLLHEYPWPGNVREMLNTLDSTLVLHGAKKRLIERDFRTCLSHGRPPFPVGSRSRPPRLPGFPGIDRPPEPAGSDRASYAREAPEAAAGPPSALVQDIFARLRAGKGTFWDLVQQPYREHTLGRGDVRSILEIGLKESRGRYTELGRLFGVESPREYKRFMDFLRLNDLRVDFWRFRREAEAPPGPNSPS